MKPIRPANRTIRIPNIRPQVCLGVIFRDNVETLPTLLASVDKHFDEYVFTDTGSVDGSRKLVDDFMKNRRGTVNEFGWIDDFAAARNHNKAASTARWYMFLDSDDQLVQGEALRDVLLKIETDQRYAHVQGLFVPYDYDVDEALPTMRLCRNTSDWKFVDAIHERLAYVGAANKDSLDPFAHLRDVSVRHKRKTPEEKKAALYRNAKIAEREYANTTDPEYKARLARTLAMIPKSEGRLDDAIPYLLEVGEGYPNHPEGRQAFSDLMRIYAGKGDFETALVYGKRAGPSYEAIALHALERYQDCINKQNIAAQIPQQTTHEGFVIEKAMAPIIQADAALKMGFEPRQIEQVINTVRGDLRAHPALAPVTAPIRAGIDRITILVPGTPQPFDGNSVRSGGMLGGSEEAVVHLAAALARLGRNVRVFGVLPPLTMSGAMIDGVEWRRFAEFNPHDEHGTLVAWRAPQVILNLMSERRRIIEARQKGDESAVPFCGIGRTSLWLHDCTMGLQDPRLAEILCVGTDSVVVLSEFHKRVLIDRDFGGKDPGNFLVLSNGIDGEAMTKHLYFTGRERDPNRVIYSSCPSRGLRTLLKMWPAVKAECPDAKLDIYYDWSMLRAAQPALHQDIVERLRAVEGLDVVHHGGVGHEQLHEALSSANVWAYTHFENTDVETSCISAMKATALGATVITVPYGALPETAPESQFHMGYLGYQAALIHALKKPESEEVRVARAKRMIDRLSWDKVAERFSAEWTVVRDG